MASSKLSEFIDLMRKTYLPQYQNNTQNNQTLNNQADTGLSRFTGLGNDGSLQRGAVAGEVHEGEQVIEANAVKAAGGSERIRRTVENMVSENGSLKSQGVNSAFGAQGGGDTFNKPQEGYKKGTGAGVARARIGYESGTQDGVVSLKKSDTFNESSIFRPDGSTETNTKKTIDGVTSETNSVTPTQNRTINGLGGRVAIDTKPPIPSPVVTGKPEDKGPELKKPEEVDLGKSASRFAISELQNLAMGSSKSQDLIDQQARNRLSATQASDQQAHSQKLAQEGLEGGMARAEEGRFRVAQSGQTASQEMELRKQREERAEQALGKVAEEGSKQQEIDLKGKELEESIRKNKSGENLTQQEVDISRGRLDEIIRSGLEGEDIEREKLALQDIHTKAMIKDIESGIKVSEGDLKMRSERWSMDKNKELSNLLIENGQFEEAASVLEDMGVKLGFDFDFNLSERGVKHFTGIAYEALGRASDAINNTELATNINSSTGLDVLNKELTDPANMLGKELKSAWDALNVGPDGKPTSGKEWGSKESLEWAKQTIVGVKLQSDEFYQSVQNVSDSTFESMIGGADALGEFEYNGYTGVKAAQQAFTHIMVQGGVRFSADGDLIVDYDNPAWSVMGIKSEEDLIGSTFLSNELSKLPVADATLKNTIINNPSEVNTAQYKDGSKVAVGEDVYQVKTVDGKPKWVNVTNEIKQQGVDETKPKLEDGIFVDKPTSEQRIKNIEVFKNDIIGKGSEPSSLQVISTISPITPSDLPHSAKASSAFLKDKSETNPGGYINYGGLALKVIEGGVSKSGSMDFSQYKTTDGIGLSKAEDGNWYAGEAALLFEQIGNPAGNMLEKLRLPKDPKLMTQAELKKYQDYFNYVTGGADDSGKFNTTRNSVNNAKSFEDWSNEPVPVVPEEPPRVYNGVKYS